VASLTLAATAGAGLQSTLESLTILYEGYDIPPIGTACRKESGRGCKRSRRWSSAIRGVDRALAEGICERLKAHVKKIQMIDPEKVDKLRD